MPEKDKESYLYTMSPFAKAVALIRRVPRTDEKKSHRCEYQDNFGFEAAHVVHTKKEGATHASS